MGFILIGIVGIIISFIRVIEIFSPKYTKAIKTVIICLSIVSILIGIINQYNKNQIERSSGKISSKTVETTEVRISLGSNTVIYDKKELIRGIDGIEAIYMLSPLQIGICIERNRLYVDCEIKNYQGKIIGKIKDNEWYTYYNSKDYILDRNYDKYGFEIIDDYGVPIIQIDYDRINENIKISGVFFNYERNAITVIYRESGFHYIGDNTLKDYPSYAVTISKNLKKIFEYPSKDFLGERKDNIKKSNQ